MARKKREEGGATSEWLNTYADMVTLLLTFFILLFSMSSLEAEKFNLLRDAFVNDTIPSTDQFIIIAEGQGEINKATNKGPDELDVEITNIEDMLAALIEYIGEHDMDDKVEVAAAGGEVIIRFNDDMLFEPDSAQLKLSDMELLDFVGLAIKSIEDEAGLISIHGYTAAMPDIPDYQVSDRILSTNRANAVLMHFEDNIGLDSTKLMSSGWGKNRPLPDADNSTEEGRSRNRRVEILISAEGNSLVDQLDNMYEKLMN